MKHRPRQRTISALASALVFALAGVGPLFAAAPPSPIPTPVPASIPVAESTAAVTPLRVVFLDVGHGDCIWIRTPDDGIGGNGRCEGYNVFIDGGPSSKRIYSQLASLGFRYRAPVEWMFLSHAHNDHYRGLTGILHDADVEAVVDPGFRHDGESYGAFCWNAVIEPGCVFYSPAIGYSTVPALKSLAPGVPCPLDWGEELDVVILYANPAVGEDGINNSSIVLKLTYGSVSFLFTGDIEGKYRPSASGANDVDHPLFAEKVLLDRYGGDGTLRSTILKIPHHGSETSSTAPFIAAVGPREGIISAGNRYGLPDDTVIKRYEAAGCRVWRTDRLDTGRPATECADDDHVIVTTDGKEYRIGYWKPDARETEK
jgi:competence protein ComEC